MTRTSSHLGKTLGAFAMTAALTVVAAPANASTDPKEVEKEVETEPLFIESARVEKKGAVELEAEVGFDRKKTEDEFELGAAASWVPIDRLELAVEVPYGFRDPDAGSSENNFGDVEFSAKYQILNEEDNAFNFSLAGNIAAPTGDRDKEIGGVGEWGVTVLAGRLIDTGEAFPDIDAHVQLGYRQQIRLTNEQLEEAEELGIGRKREKELVWGAALTMPLSEGRFVPTLELIGTTILDAIDRDEEGTIVEIGGGVWLKPFKKVKDLTIGAAVKTPVTNRHESDFSALLVVKYEFN